MKDYRTTAYERFRTGPAAFIKRNVQKLLLSPKQAYHDLQNVVQRRSSGQDSHIPHTATDKDIKGWHFSTSASQQVVQDLLRSHGQDHAVTHVYGHADGKITYALRDFRPANFRFSTCMIGRQSPAFFREPEKVNGAMPFIGFREQNISLSILSEEVDRLGPQVIVQQLEKGTLKHDALKTNVQNLLVSDPTGYLPWLIYHCNYHTRLIVVLTDASMMDSEVVQDYLAIADAVLAPVGWITRAEYSANLYEYNDTQEIQQLFATAILSLGQKPRNMLLPVYKGRTFCPELFDAHSSCEAVCYILGPNKSGHSTFESMIAEMADNVEAIYFREELALRFRDLAAKAELEENPKELLIASLKHGVRYECKTLSSAN